MTDYRSYSSMRDLTGVKKKPLGLQYVVAPTREKAIIWERELKESIRKYGKVTVSQLYELTAKFPNPIKPMFPDFSYGWTKEEDIHYVANADGYWFNLPTPINLGSSEAAEETIKHTEKIYLVLENDFSSPFPSLHDVYPTFDEALGSAYTKASVIHGTCQKHEGHYPLLMDYYNKGFKVIDEKDGTCHICYVEEREVELC